MTITGFVVLLLVAGICGSIAQGIAGYSHGGCLVSIALGFIGAVLGNWIASALGLSEILAIQMDGQTFPIVWSIIGAAIFVAILNLLRPRRERVTD